MLQAHGQTNVAEPSCSHVKPATRPRQCNRFRSGYHGHGALHPLISTINRETTEMPRELRSADALCRDLMNAVCESEGKAPNIGGDTHPSIARAYAFQLINEAKRAINSRQPSAPGPETPYHTAAGTGM